MQRALFQTGNLCLTDSDFIGDLHLRFAAKKAQIQNPFLTVIQIVQRLAHYDLAQPVFVAVLISNLIHYIDRIAAVRVGSVEKQADLLRERQSRIEQSAGKGA